ncbi:S41 family peptidase [Acidobacteriota bacterium]
MRKKNLGVSFVILFVCGIWLFQLAFSSPVEESSGQETLYSMESLKEDFKILRNALEEGHGALYRFSTKEEMDKRFNDVFSKLNKTKTEREFLKLLAPLVASVNCGHTRLRPSTALTRRLNRDAVFLPFRIKFIKGKAFLLHNLSDNIDLNMGGQVIAINGRSIPDIMEVFLGAVSSDALIETSKFRYLESTQQFSSLFNLFFGRTDQYEVEYRSPQTGQVEKVTVPGYPIAELNARFEKRYPELNQSNPPISFEYKEGIPVLTVRTFGGTPYSRAKISFPVFVKDTFQELIEKGEENLIIDMRNNGGGSDAFGKILFAHLIDKPFDYYGALEMKKLEFDFLEFSNVPKKRRIKSEKFFRKNDRGWFDFLAHPNVGLQKPIEPHFEGKVYVLINGGSFSATGETTSLMHFHKKAVFIGEECGAGYYGNTSGSMPTLILPHTKILVGVPLMRYTMAVDGYPKDRGIIPEFPVEPTIEDLLNGQDTVLNYALKLIKSKSGK